MQKHNMLPQELQDYIHHGKEETYLEYKASMRWSARPRNTEDKVVNYKIIKAMMALSNNTNGGVIVIGEKERRNGEFKPTGISKRNYDTFKYDVVSQYVKNVCAPQIQFKITRGSTIIEGKQKRFVVIQVAESVEFPVVCTIFIKKDDSHPSYPENILLRENAIYIRSKAPIGSREIANLQQWQDLIYRIMEKSKKELLKKMPCFDYFEDKEKKGRTKKAEGKRPVGTAEFDNQRKKDNL